MKEKWIKPGQGFLPAHTAWMFQLTGCVGGIGITIEGLKGWILIAGSVLFGACLYVYHAVEFRIPNEITTNLPLATSESESEKEDKASHHNR